jgi:hypothetical protein
MCFKFRAHHVPGLLTGRARSPLVAVPRCICPCSACSVASGWPSRFGLATAWARYSRTLSLLARCRGCCRGRLVACPRSASLLLTTAAAPLLLLTPLGCMRVRLSALPRYLPPTPHTVTRLLPSQPTSRPCLGPSTATSRSVAAPTCHAISLLHVHVLAWLLHVPSRSRRPHPAYGGDLSADSVSLPPLSSVHHDRWGRSLCVGRERSPPSISSRPWLCGLVALPIDPTSP